MSAGMGHRQKVTGGYGVCRKSQQRGGERLGVRGGGEEIGRGGGTFLKKGFLLPSQTHPSSSQDF